jgi:hypothetical protein
MHLFVRRVLVVRVLKERTHRARGWRGHDVDGTRRKQKTIMEKLILGFLIFDPITIKIGVYTCRHSDCMGLYM